MLRLLFGVLSFVCSFQICFVISILHEEKARVELGVHGHVVVVPLAVLVSALGSGMVARHLPMCSLMVILSLVSLASWRTSRRRRGFAVSCFGLVDIELSRCIMRCCTSSRPG